MLQIKTSGKYSNLVKEYYEEEKKNAIQSKKKYSEPIGPQFQQPHSGSGRSFGNTIPKVWTTPQSKVNATQLKVQPTNSLGVKTQNWLTPTNAGIKTVKNTELPKGADIRDVANTITYGLGNFANQAVKSVWGGAEYIGKQLDNPTNKKLLEMVPGTGTVFQIYNTAEKIQEDLNSLGVPIQPKGIGDVLADFSGEIVNRSENIDKRLQQKMEEKSNLSKKVVDLSGAVGHMIPGMVAGVIAPGSNLASMGTFMTTAAGGYYREGLNRGMTEQNALNYATLMGGLEGASESLSFGKLGEGIKTLSKGAIKEGLIDAGIGILENATQEALMEPAGELTSGIFGGESTFKDKNGNVNIFNKESWKELAPRMIESGIDGALVYVLLGGIGAGYTKANQIGTKISQGEQVTQAEINDAVNEMKEAGMPVEEIKQKFNETVEKIEKNTEMPTSQEKTTDINSPRIDFLNEGNINTSLENSENTLYNNNRGDINENNTRNEQYDKRRIQELLEKYQRGESISTPDGTKLSGISQNQKARERTAKIELINYANSYAKLELNATEQNLKNIINNLGGNVVFYELGNDNIWPGLANGETFYIDTIGGESVENIFYHEITHFLRQNKNNIYMKEIQPIVDEIAKDYENYQEIIFNYANSKEFFSVKDLDGTRQNELAEEVVADYIASIYSNLETDYGLSDDMIQKIKNSMDQILNRENSKMSSFSMQQNMQVPDLIKADNAIKKQQHISEDVKTLNNIKNIIEKTNLDTYNLDDTKEMNKLKMNFTTPIRVIEKIFNKETATKIKDNFFQPIKHNEAEKIRFLNRERNEIKNLGIKPKSKESAAVQKYGEGEVVDIKTGESTPYTINDLKREFPNNWETIKNASELLRNKYDTYLDKINKVLNENGYNSIPKRKDYFRHFEEITNLFEIVGIPTQTDNLPTDINGVTDTFAPGKNFFVNALKRTGNKTTYDAITGIDGYLNVAGNLIFHTGDIQNLRTLEKYIRDIYGQGNGTDIAKDLPSDEYMTRIKQIQEGHLSEFVSWLKEYTNNIAGKKSMIDRSAESLFGRRIYKTLNLLKKQVGSNLTGFNINSALSNFISATQGFAKTNKKAFIQGTVDTIKNMFKDDGFIDKSDFLTTRFGSDKLSKTLWEKMSDAGQIFMSGTDYFTANQIVRGKYHEYLDKGYTETQAIKKADEFADKLMAGRGLGDMPNAFNSKMLGIITQFQLETTNQLDSIFYDTFNEDYAKDNKYKFANEHPKAYNGAVATFILGQLFAYAYLFNREKEELTGNGGAFDPLGTIEKAFKLYENGDLFTSNGLKTMSKEIGNLIPFSNILTGGGRIPIADALPDISGILNGDTTLSKEAWGLLNLVAPTGGGQIKKSIQAGQVLKKGGDYNYTSKGEKLRFATGFEDMSDTEKIARTVQALTFGQYSLPNARKYVDSGFKALSESQTEKYKEARNVDISTKEFYELLEAVKNAESDKNAKGETIPLSKAKKQKQAIDEILKEKDEDVKRRAYGIFDISEKLYKK